MSIMHDLEPLDEIAYIEVRALPSVDPGALPRRVRLDGRSPAEAEAVFHRLLADYDPQLYTVTPHHGDDQVRKEACRC